MGERILKILRGQAVTSIIYILLGICLGALPVGTVYDICKWLFGLVLVVCGVYHIYGYLKEKPGATVLDLFSGVILLVMCGFLILNPQIVVKILPILLGAFVFFDCIWKLRSAWRLKKQKDPLWKAFLIGGLVFVGLSAVLMYNPFTAVKYTALFAGLTILGSGVVDLVFLLLQRLSARKAGKSSGNTSAESDEAAEETNQGTENRMDVSGAEAAEATGQGMENRLDVSDAETAEQEPESQMEAFETEAAEPEEQNTPDLTLEPGLLEEPADAGGVMDGQELNEE